MAFSSLGLTLKPSGAKLSLEPFRKVIFYDTQAFTTIVEETTRSINLSRIQLILQN